MLDTIKQFHQKNGYYPNEVQLTELLGVSRGTVRRRMQELLKQGTIQPAEPKVIYTGKYKVI